MTENEELRRILARFASPWTVEIRNQKSNYWSSFCHDAPLTLTEAEERERALKADNPDADLRVTPWLNSSQRDTVNANTRIRLAEAQAEYLKDIQAERDNHQKFVMESARKLAEVLEQKRVIGEAIYEIHGMLVSEPLEADDARTFREALHELRVEADKIIQERKIARALVAALKEAHQEFDGCCADTAGTPTQQHFAALLARCDAALSRAKDAGLVPESK